MPPNAGDPPESPVRIKHDGKFYARLLTRESSLSNPSFRYYGAGPGSVPFVWESQPGTPKDAAIMAADVPAITPPPSYHLRRDMAVLQYHKRKGKAKGKKHCYKFRWIKIGFIAAVFRRLALGRPARPSSSAQGSSSTRWLFSSTTGVERDEHRLEPAAAAPAMLCFRVRPSAWMVQLCGRRNRGDLHGWV